jgi:hypothetical protein
MSRTYIPKDLRDRVAATAHLRCGYCLSAEAIVGAAMEIDHIIPESLGGQTEEEDMCAAGWHPPKDDSPAKSDTSH